MLQHKADEPNPMVIMGRVAAAHGIQGWVKVQPYTGELDSLLDYSTWWIGDEQQGWRELDVLQSAVQGKSVVAQLMGCHDRNTAETYKGLLVAVPRSRLPQPEADEYYWSDLIGLEVVNLEGETLGKVENLLDTGANQVLCVCGREREILIPFIAQVIGKVDLEGKTIRADWQADY